MTSDFSLNREYFEKLLASAFSVQQSGVDAHSLSTLVGLQQLIAAVEPDADAVMHLAADRARSVAHATGTAVALLNGDQLAYRAGSVSAASYVGQHATAVLNVPAHNKARGEILRVENAHTDARIQAAICRQFGAQSLLILPIYRESALAGLFVVLFDEAHAFQDREVRTYQLMTRLLEEAMFRKPPLDRNKALATQTTNTPPVIAQITSQAQSFRDDDQSVPGPAPRPWTEDVCQPVTVATEKLPVRSDFTQAAAVTPWRKFVPLRRLKWNVVEACAVTALVIGACWIAYSRHPHPPARATSLPASTAVQQQIPFVPAKPEPLKRAPRAQTAAGKTEKAKHPGSGFKWVRVGPNEIDEIAEDVTIRHFTSKTLPPVPYNEVHFGKDVTTRHFVSPPVPTAAQSLDPSSPVSK